MLPRTLFISGTLVLAWLSYGGITDRGLVSDDYVYGWLAHLFGYWEGVVYWHDTNPAGGRLTLALFTPFFYKAFCGAGPLACDLGALHGVLVATHLTNASLVWWLMRRYGLGPLASGSGALLFLLHPAKYAAVLWPAASYGYGLGALCFLAGWHLLHERSPKTPAWMLPGVLLWLAAALTIEQFIVMELALLGLWVVKGPGKERRRSLRVAHACVALFLAGAFLTAHFGPGSTTSDRIEHYAKRPTAPETSLAERFAPAKLGSAARILAWRLNPGPDHSPYAATWKKVEPALRGAGLAVLVAGCLLAAGGLALWEFRRGHRTTERFGPGRAAGTGALLIGAAVFPFLAMGLGSGPERATLPILIGIALLAGGGLQWLLDAMARFRGAARGFVAAAAAVLLLPALAAFTAVNLGYRTGYEEDWRIARRVFAELERRGLEGGELVVLDGEAATPFRDTWGLYYAVRWMSDDRTGDVWTPEAYAGVPEPEPGQRVLAIR